MIYLLLFWEFFQIGLFAVGGGLVTVPFLFDLSCKVLLPVLFISNSIELLSIGQKLLVPETDESVTSLPSYINYTVKSGDTLYSIAKKYNTTVNDILKDNNLNTTSLSLGQNIKIRTTGTEAVEECYGEEFMPVDNSIKYVVKKGDSLWTIAKKYNTSVDNIKSKNNLTNNNLSIGQVLKI